MHELTELIRQDMRPALGVTEPGAIAFAVSTARKHAPGIVRNVTLRLNSGMFKNAFTCGIPGSSEVGNYHAAALGAVGADPDKGLECLDGITPEQAESAKAMVKAGKIEVEMSEITSRIFIEATVEATGGSACVTIRDAHTNIVKITENGRTVFEKESAAASEQDSVPVIHRYTLEQLHQYALTVPVEEISFIKEAFKLNYTLCKAGLESPKTTYSRYLLAKNGGKIISDDEQKTASLLCNAAIEARVIGLPDPAMSITGMICDGGNQGCTMKGVVAVDAAWQSVGMAMQNVFIYNVHGINGATPEPTMHNMGRIASPGMVGTEKTIVDILRDKKM